MRVKFTIILLILSVIVSWAQKVSLNPTISPALFRYNDQITVTYDVTGTSLASLASAWFWVWIPNTAINASYNFNPAASNPVSTDHAKCTKSTSSGKTLFTITFKPSDFFSSSISTQTQLGILLKGNDWSNGQTTDFIASIWDGSFQVKLTSPSVQPLFVANGNTISIQASTPIAANYSLRVNDTEVDAQTNISSYTQILTVSDSVKFYKVLLIASANSTSDTASFSYLIPQASPVLTRPSGIIDGINYSSDQTKATLSFWAPGKTSVYAFGDFTDWNVSPSYLMKKDGEHFWIELTGLAPNKEYAFQYLVDQTLKIADPYADKVLAPVDTQIPATTYPNLKQIPQKAVNSEWYYNRFSVLQTGQAPYQWKTTNYKKPNKEK